MKHDNRYFKNGNKQLLKEFIAMLVVMLILGLVGFGLGWYKGHMIWQPDPEESRLIKTPKIIWNFTFTQQYS
mgnify:CR=1 FL=1